MERRPGHLATYARRSGNQLPTVGLKIWFDTQVLRNEVQAYMARERVTLSYAAEQIGINKATLSRFLHMTREPDVQTATLLCFWIEKELQEFVRREFRD